ncbi:MAG: 50S ribosomal protein L9 [Myxococcales bacterium]|nr:50S ribosomal protein L9 [Myxococcales bacterium]
MQVILREDISNLGKSGELVSVKPGYGRNYLIPQGMAVLATERNVKLLEHHKRTIAQRNAKLLKDAQSVAEKLASLTLKFARQAGEGGKLFGTVSTRDIEEEAKKAGVALDRKKLHLAEHIKTVGEYTVDVKLSQGVVAKLKVQVTAA